MTDQLILGTLVMVTTVVIAAIFAGSAIWALQKANHWLIVPPHGLKIVGSLAFTVLWIQIAVAVCVLIWALVFLWLGIFPEMETAVYFSIVSFTTLGFGDVLLPEEWRLLGGLEAANGLLMFGFVTAFLVETMRRIWRDQVQIHIQQNLKG